ncbi:uncharacterized protein LOC123712278 [Pieris brassicae]|uniref:uncharacterized protein LOC123712278 n=1 Tax=Pieris brassicae TaxID=7116 RepID=UPI001E65E888|nr:uncharacterized protein LOC123712278 [Pieris brassicae]
MSQRLNEMNWIWSILVIYLGQTWSPVSGGALPNQPKPSATGVIESQAKFFQDFFSVQLSPYKIEFGHVCEDPNTWEQRYEKKDYKNHRDMGKVRWGDKKGGYGEHYWDLNHAGHNNDHDDGEYHSDDDSYDESSEQSSNYEDIQKDTNDESERRKRAHTNSSKEHRTAIVNDENEERTQKKPKIQQEPSKRVKNDIVLIVNERDRAVKEPRRFLEPPNQDLERQKLGSVSQPSSQPRLYFEPTTGHVIDRRTGQAFFLQPIVVN